MLIPLAVSNLTPDIGCIYLTPDVKCIYLTPDIPRPAFQVFHEVLLQSSGQLTAFHLPRAPVSEPPPPPPRTLSTLQPVCICLCCIFCLILLPCPSRSNAHSFSLKLSVLFSPFKVSAYNHTFLQDHPLLPGSKAACVFILPHQLEDHPFPQLHVPSC